MSDRANRRGGPPSGVHPSLTPGHVIWSHAPCLMIHPSQAFKFKKKVRRKRAYQVFGREGGNPPTCETDTEPRREAGGSARAGGCKLMRRVYSAVYSHYLVVFVPCKKRSHNGLIENKDLNPTTTAVFSVRGVLRTIRTCFGRNCEVCG